MSIFLLLNQHKVSHNYTFYNFLLKIMKIYLMHLKINLRHNSRLKSKELLCPILIYCSVGPCVSGFRGFSVANAIFCDANFLFYDEKSTTFHFLHRQILRFCNKNSPVSPKDTPTRSSK